MRLFLAAAFAATPALAEPVVPTFIEETATAGLTTVYEGDWEYMVGGGVATFDCNGDRFPEVFLPGGAGLSALYLNRSPQGGALAFEKTDAMSLDAVLGAYPLDIDSDGVMDLVVLRLGQNRLYRGLGNCAFEDASAAWGFDGGDAWSTAFAAIWEKGQTWPTLAIGNYVDRKEEAFPWGSCTDNWLHRPVGEGFAPPLPLTPSFCALSMLFTDWNRSGQPSLRVSNDREYYKGGQEQLWHLDPDQPPRLFTEAEGWKRLRIWGMGIASADITGDGYPDYYLTSMADNKLQVLKDPTLGLPDFADVAFAKGATAHRPYTGDDLNPSTAWHPQFADVNNDGLLDLFVAKGNVAKMPDFALKDPNNLMLQTAEGPFVEAGDRAGVASTEVSRGAQVVDLNLDGALDLVVVNRWTQAEVWRGDAATIPGAWVQVRLEQPGPNRDAIGAVVELRRGEGVERHEVTSGGGHVSGSVGWLHFGLGAATTAEMRIIWPDGREGPWQTLPAGSFQILQPDQPAQAWQPG
jgi:enediyne biosynthesis protein E4